VNCGIGIDGLELDLFYPTWRISNALFFEDLLRTGANSRMGIIDVVIEHGMSFMITIRNAIVRNFTRDLPLKESLNTAATNLFDILQH
jgi:hypothetical protein